MPVFTVVMPTRNRPALFRTALASVLAQQDPGGFEVVAVIDGADEAQAAAYAAILATATGDVRSVTLPLLPAGHGPSYAMNTGVAQARGDYVCFLDDDDVWTDPGHLARAARVIAAQGAPDLYLANQSAWQDDRELPGPVWIENLLSRVPNLPGPDPDGSYAVTAADLLQAQGGAHMNTAIFRRDFWRDLGGMNEGLRYAGDWDLFLRAIDRAASIRYVPDKVARHNVPVAALRSNESTQLSDAQKKQTHLQVLDRALVHSTQPVIRRFAARAKVYALQDLARAMAAAGRMAEAGRFAREALALRPDPRWLPTAVAYSLRSLMRGR